MNIFLFVFTLLEEQNWNCYNYFYDASYDIIYINNLYSINKNKLNNLYLPVIKEGIQFYLTNS